MLNISVWVQDRLSHTRHWCELLLSSPGCCLPGWWCSQPGSGTIHSGWAGCQGWCGSAQSRWSPCLGTDCNRLVSQGGWRRCCRWNSLCFLWWRVLMDSLSRSRPLEDLLRRSGVLDTHRSDEQCDPKIFYQRMCDGSRSKSSSSSGTQFIWTKHIELRHR